MAAEVEGRCGAAAEDLEASSEDAEGESLAAMAAAVRALLAGLGEDLARPGLQRTPLRVGRALRFATKGSRQTARDIIGRALFTEEGAGGGSVKGGGGGVGGMVVVRDVDLFSCCRACLLPFRIRCHLAYIPAGERVVGLSKLPRIAEAFARRLQTPQRLAQQLANAVYEAFEPLGVVVALECWHLGEVVEVERVHVPRGNPNFSGNGNGVTEKKANSFKGVTWKAGRRVICKGVGAFSGKASELWAEFGAILGIEEDRWQYANGEDPELLECGTWLRDGKDSEIAEMNSLGVDLTVDPRSGSLEEMVDAAKTLLRGMGEDLGLREIEMTARRFVRQLMVSTRGSTRSLEDVLNRNAGVTREELFDHSRKLYNPCNENGIFEYACFGQEIRVKAGSEGEERERGLLGQFYAVTNIPVTSLCEHHLLPFFGHVHVGYIGGASCALQRTKLEEIVELYGCRPQVQERLTRQVAEAVAIALEGGRKGGEGEAMEGEIGVVVVVEASHMCMVSRGIEKGSSSTSTIAALGRFSLEHRLRLSFLKGLSRGVKVATDYGEHRTS